jgi:hypothetical protein
MAANAELRLNRIVYWLRASVAEYDYDGIRVWLIAVIWFVSADGLWLGHGVDVCVVYFDGVNVAVVVAHFNSDSFDDIHGGDDGHGIVSWLKI